jgi:hypothetical protein
VHVHSVGYVADGSLALAPTLIFHQGSYSNFSVEPRIVQEITSHCMGNVLYAKLLFMLLSVIARTLLQHCQNWMAAEHFTFHLYYYNVVHPHLAIISSVYSC